MNRECDNTTIKSHDKLPEEMLGNLLQLAEKLKELDLNSHIEQHLTISYREVRRVVAQARQPLTERVMGELATEGMSAIKVAIEQDLPAVPAPWVTMLYVIACQTLKEEFPPIRETEYGESRDLSPRPDFLTQQTWPEISQAMVAMTDNSNKWHDVPGEMALYYALPDKPLQMKFAPSPLWGKEQVTYDELRAELAEAGCDAAMLYNIKVGWALQQPQVTTNIDVLIDMLGWDPRTSAERGEMRQLIWRWIRIYDSLLVCGERDGRFRDHNSRTILDLTSEDALIKVMGTRWHKESSRQQPPNEITWALGPWVQKYRTDKEILTYYGNILKIAEIPAKQPSGKWARSIALALNWRWRINSKNAKVARVGEEKQLTVKFPSFTRWQMLNTFRTEPWVEDILKGSDPQRARSLWDSAIKLNKQTGIIGYFSPNTLSQAQEGRKRWPKGWEQNWLYNDLLDIRPGKQWTDAVIGIAAEAEKAKSKRKQKQIKAK